MIYQKINELLNRGQEFYIITVVDKSGHAPSTLSSKMVILKEGQFFGTIGGGALEEMAVEKARVMFSQPESKLVHYNLDARDSYKEGSARKPNGENAGNEREDPVSGQKGRYEEIKTDMICGGSITLFFEHISPIRKIVIFGGGNIGQALVYHLNPLGFKVCVIDDREEVTNIYSGEEVQIICSPYESVFSKNGELKKEGLFVIATNSHLDDEVCLRETILNAEKPEYIAMIASSNKAKIIRQNIEKYCLENNFKKPDFSTLYSPAGLYLGGRSPQEISIAILAQLQAVLYGIPDITHKHLVKK